MEGFIYLHRKLLNWEWFDDAIMVKAFVTCLLLANYKEKKWQGHSIERGSFVTSNSNLSKILNLSEMRTRICIKKLKKSQCITSKTTNKFTIISICNYDDYQTLQSIKEQTNEQTDNKQTTNEQQTDNKQITTTNNTNNTNNTNKDNKYYIYFENFRKKYKGTKKGNETEFNNFKKQKDWLKVINLLEPAVDSQILWRKTAKDNDIFYPEWKNLTTWINQRCWEEECPEQINDIINPKRRIPKAYEGKKEGIYAFIPSMTLKDFENE